MKILRIGSFHGAPYRYINLIKNNPSDDFKWIHLEGDLSIQALKNLVDLEDINNISFLTFPKSAYLRTFQRISHNSKIKFSPLFYPLYVIIFKIFVKLSNLPLEINKAYEQSDFIWIGNNDLDYCLTLTSFFKYKFPNKNINLSYQEHRSKFRFDEKLALKLSDRLIIPSTPSMEILEGIYNINLRFKTSIANEDWRSKCYQFIGEKPKNKTPKILIISNFAEYGLPSERRGSRVNYIKVLDVFLNLGAEVSLYVNKICFSYGYPNENKNTPYHKLNDNNPNFELIQGPLSLNSKDDYKLFYHFDYGFLHNYIEGESVNKFNSINIPNRLFEYLNMGIKPIILEGSLKEAEKILKAVEIYFPLKQYSDLLNKHELEPNSFYFESNNLTFENFYNILVNKGNLLKRS